MDFINDMKKKEFLKEILNINSINDINIIIKNDIKIFLYNNEKYLIDYFDKLELVMIKLMTLQIDNNIRINPVYSLEYDEEVQKLNDYIINVDDENIYNDYYIYKVDYKDKNL